MRKFRTLVAATTLATFALLLPASAHAAPVSQAPSSSVVAKVLGWKP